MKKMELLRERLKKIYLFFGRLLTSCFVAILVMIGLIYGYAQIPAHCPGLVLPQMPGDPPIPWYQTIDILEILGYIFAAAFLVGFCASLIYLILGIVKFFITRSKKKKNPSIKLLLLRGIIGMILFVLLYFAISSELALVPMCL